jgi:hypothetical protein
VILARLVQRVLLVIQDQQALSERLAHKVLLDHKGYRAYKVFKDHKVIQAARGLLAHKDL